MTPDYDSPVVALVPSTVEVIDAGTFTYVPHLQNLHRGSIGFLPTVALHEYEQRRQLWLARDNGQPCGYLAWGSFRGDRPVRDPYTIKIIQACIDYDARNRDHGAQLVHDLERTAIRAGIQSISLWCASDLPANQFWAALGFDPVDTRIGGSALIRDRVHTRWVKTLPVIIRGPIEFSPAVRRRCKNFFPFTPPSSKTGPRKQR